MKHPGRRDKRKPKGANILDLLSINKRNMISEIEVGREQACSDHRKIRFNLQWAVIQKLNIVIATDFTRHNYEGFRRHLEEVNCRAKGLDEGWNSGLNPMHMRVR